MLWITANHRLLNRHRVPVDNGESWRNQPEKLLELAMRIANRWQSSDLGWPIVWVATYQAVVSQDLVDDGLSIKQ